MTATRRAALGFAGLALTAGFARAERDGDPVTHLTAAITDRPAAAAIGRAWLRGLAEPPDLVTLRQHVAAALQFGDPRDPGLGTSTHSAHFTAQVRRDFDEGHVEMVDGWMLSRIETQLCAIVCLITEGEA